MVQSFSGYSIAGFKFLCSEIGLNHRLFLSIFFCLETKETKIQGGIHFYAIF
jgi:hypothetical protein